MSVTIKSTTKDGARVEITIKKTNEDKGSIEVKKWKKGKDPKKDKPTTTETTKLQDIKTKKDGSKTQAKTKAVGCIYSVHAREQGIRT